MKIGELLAGVQVRSITGPAEPEISSIAYNSREARPGGIFFALRGEKTDGNRFIPEVLERGVSAICSELPRPPHALWNSFLIDKRPLDDFPASVAWVQAQSARKALATAAANFLGRPAEALQLLGVTGTNGKTTTTHLIDSILRAAGFTTALLGTLIYRTPASSRTARNTTPESLDLQQMFAELRDAGGSHAVLEASSHALSMDRLWGCHFAVAVFTNLTREHLDYHHDFEHYFAAKRRLFEGTGAGAPDTAIINMDDPWGRDLQGLAVRTLTYGLRSAADLTAGKLQLRFSGLDFIARTPQGEISVSSSLVGRINVYNILAAIGAVQALGIERDTIQRGIHSLASVPGRFERIDEGQPFLVVVDYAHTDDAIRNLIATARELNQTGRIITLFGAGGDRDRSKRPLMGEAAGSLSDLVVLTSDNPRSEDPLRIINDVLVGLQKANARYHIEPDREKAIELAISEAGPGDVVLLAGKGHENYQIMRDRTFEFSDRSIARKMLRQRGFSRRS